MIIFASILAGISMLLLIIFFITVQIEILFKREQEDDHGEVRVSVLKGLIHYNIQIPKLKWEGVDDGIEIEQKDASISSQSKDSQITAKSIKEAQNHFQQLLARIHHFFEIVGWFVTKIRCEKLKWVTQIGTGDAAETGMLVGGLWGIQASVLGWISHQVHCNCPVEVEVIPSFQQPLLHTHFHSMIRFRLGYAILAAVRLVIHMRKGKDRRKWLITPFKA
ncbi:DUF2953 domain-containing protein [Hazenella sp. IB182357]|uniref:DUF2953 domain-containing protein n=1 Tax=Polycladospora coralii TaxID=2771432 RepID=A0A926NAJ0_9BACL|nr:DUF2953 domain-containing protein [Polycladospora coralii]MBD1372952.1 DUF2953 domain-containing protein [Polycladospora coralii]MBS7530991.1 DUF2953 domain-containing protein [Polycladospora coralii]